MEAPPQKKSNQDLSEAEQLPFLGLYRTEKLLENGVFDQIILAIVNKDISVLEIIISDNNIPTTIKPGEYFVNQFPLNFIALFLKELITDWNKVLPPEVSNEVSNERFFEIATIFLSEAFNPLDFSDPESWDLAEVMERLKQNNFINRKKPTFKKDSFGFPNLMQYCSIQIGSLLQLLDIIGVFREESTFQNYLEMYGKGGKNSKYRPNNFFSGKELWRVEEEAPTFLQWFIYQGKLNP